MGTTKHRYWRGSTDQKEHHLDGGEHTGDEGSSKKRWFEHLLASWHAETLLHRFSLLFMFAAGVGVRLAFLFQPIMHDEAQTYQYFVLFSPKTIVSDFTVLNNHILHSLLAQFSTNFLGHQPWALRFPAFIAGVLIIPVAYLVVRRLLSRNAALLATALCVPSSILIEYSTNARGYSLQTLLFLLAVLAAISAKRNGSRPAWVWLVVLSALCFYTITTMVFFYLSLVAWLALSVVIKDVAGNPKRFAARLAISVTVTCTLVALLYLPVVLHSGLKSITSNQYLIEGTWSSSVRGAVSAPGLGFPLFASIILALGFILSLLFNRRVAKDRVSLALVILVTCPLVVLAMWQPPPARTWLPAIPLYYGFSSAGLLLACKTAWGAADRWRHFKRVSPTVLFHVSVLVVCALLVMGVVLWQAPYQPKDQLAFRDAPTLASWLAGNLKPGDIVYVEQNIRKMLQYYFLVDNIPCAYLYKWPEDTGTEYDSIKRAFIVDADSEGYPLERAFQDSNLEPSRQYVLTPAVEIGDTKVFLIENPLIRQP